MKKLLTLLLVGFLSLPSHADILVEVHGYLGSSRSWDDSGINDELAKGGWHIAGLLRSTRAGIVLRKNIYFDENKYKNRIYNVDLPSQAPLWVQSDQLIEMLKWIAKTFPKQNIHIVGHSAGGVVARVSILNKQVKNVKTLITIASPHLGTSRALEALDFSNNMFFVNQIKDVFTGGLNSTLRNSRGLLIDLLPPKYGQTLTIINNKPHPDIRYVSVIRTQQGGLTGDILVPGFSQDMNAVKGIKHQSEVIYTPTGHVLVRGDGDTILKILNPQRT